MTAEEAYKHKWKVGEIIWGIRRSYQGGYLQLSELYKHNTDSYTTKHPVYPEEVIPLKVVEIKNPEYGPFATGCHEFLFIDFEGDSTRSVYGDYCIGVNIDKDASGNIKKIYPNFDSAHLECKFFDKAEAEEYIITMKKNIKKNYTSCIKACTKNIEKLKRYIAENETHVKLMQESIDKINI